MKDHIEEKMISLTEEMKVSYLDYSMSVIVSRALPDVRDGLKPVHRRILYSMYESGYLSNKPYKKSARVVGDVMSRYHPHGDSAIYDSMVRLAQDFSMRVNLIDGQGNFGSIDNDPAAAMRYTEARMTKLSEAMLSDIDKSTVDFQTNYDASSKEPKVLPTRFPNLLINGSSGIAVGMATNFPPHNPTEIIKACCAIIEDSTLSEKDLLEIVKGPDFPTGGIIVGSKGVEKAISSGQGVICICSRYKFETENNSDVIVFTEIPYMVSKKKIVEGIAHEVRKGTLEGISDLKDESNRKGIRIVVKLKRGTIKEVILSRLFKYTQLRVSFGIRMLALDKGIPECMSLRKVIDAFIAFRREVVSRRHKYLLNKARDMAHILAGLSIAVNNIDMIIRIIRNSKDVEEAKKTLLGYDWSIEGVKDILLLVDDPRYKLSSGNRSKLSLNQVKAILEIRLQKLTSMEIVNLSKQISKISDEIIYHLKILKDTKNLDKVILTELSDVLKLIKSSRRTEIIEKELVDDEEELIPVEDMVITLSKTGYIKRVPLDVYRTQRRGGFGRSVIHLKENDLVFKTCITSSHEQVLFFSSSGKVYRTKVYNIPLSTVVGKGKPVVNVFPLEKREFIASILTLGNHKVSNRYFSFVTSLGGIKRNVCKDFENIYVNGKKAMKLQNGEVIISVFSCSDEDDILICTKKGKCLRFPVSKVPVFKSRSSGGVKGINLAEGDGVMSASIVSKENSDNVSLFTITKKGLGKKTRISEYSTKLHRRGLGVSNIKLSKDDEVIFSELVDGTEEIIIYTRLGKGIRLDLAKELNRNIGRSTRGIKLLKLREDDKIASVSVHRD